MNKLITGLENAGYSKETAVLIAEERLNWIKAEKARCITEIRKQEIIRFEFRDISKPSENRVSELTGERLAGWELKTYERILELQRKLEALEAMCAA